MRSKILKPSTISVCIPVFNCREHIAQAVDSVSAQTLFDFELIVIDNCSDEGAFELLSACTIPESGFCVMKPTRETL